jgi:serine/threonine protein kinase
MTNITRGPSLPLELSIEEGSDHVDIEVSRLPYTVERTLGVGGCSVVEEVKDCNTQQVFARKVFMLRRRNMQSMKELFENEVRIIRTLEHHHHMIRVFATYTTPQQLALIMSPVANGGDLDKFLGELVATRSDFRSLKAMGDIVEKAFGCLAAGLAFMRAQRIRHKDIKPHNILIHHGRVLYTDFGLSLDSTTDEKVMLCIVVLATRARVHEVANLRALVSWPIGGPGACLAVGASQHGNGSRHTPTVNASTW